MLSAAYRRNVHSTMRGGIFQPHRKIWRDDLQRRLPRLGEPDRVPREHMRCFQHHSVWEHSRHGGRVLHGRGCHLRSGVRVRVRRRLPAERHVQPHHLRPRRRLAHTLSSLRRYCTQRTHQRTHMLSLSETRNMRLRMQAAHRGRNHACNKRSSGSTSRSFGGETVYLYTDACNHLQSVLPLTVHYIA